MKKKRDERNDKAVKKQALRILRERIENPMLGWDTVLRELWKPEGLAAEQLVRAEYLTNDGHITLAGVDYYRRDAHKIRTWLAGNWFPAFVAALTAAVTLAAAVITVVFANSPC